MISFLKFLKKQIKIFLLTLKDLINTLFKFFKILFYLIYRNPFALGYDEYKWVRIKKKLNDKSKQIDEENASGIDERIIEYKWIVNELSEKNGRLLDAGSTINFKPILKKLKNFDISIQTLYPEEKNFNQHSVSYIYADLKNLIFKENYFDYITCISTLEHVGFNNDHYDYYNNKSYSKIENNPKDYLNVIKNFHTILKSGGELYLTLPFGKKQVFNHLQQFDSEEIKILKETFLPSSSSENFFIYKNHIWQECREEDCKDVSFRTLEEKKPKDNAASARSMIFLKLRK